MMLPGGRRVLHWMWGVIRMLQCGVACGAEGRDSASEQLEWSSPGTTEGWPCDEICACNFYTCPFVDCHQDTYVFSSFYSPSLLRGCSSPLNLTLSWNSPGCTASLAEDWQMHPYWEACVPQQMSCAVKTLRQSHELSQSCHVLQEVFDITDS